MRRGVLLAGLLPLAFVVATPSGRAACVVPPDLEDLVRAGPHADDFYDTIFIGTVTAIRPSVEAGSGDEGITAVYTPVDLSVEAGLWGEVEATVTIMNPGGTLPGSDVGMWVEDTFEFQEGVTYAVVAHRNLDGTFKTNACTPTQQVNNDRAQLLIALAPNPTLFAEPLGETGEATGSPQASPDAGRAGWVVPGAVAAAILVLGASFLAFRRRIARSAR